MSSDKSDLGVPTMPPQNPGLGVDSTSGIEQLLNDMYLGNELPSSSPDACALDTGAVNSSVMTGSRDSVVPSAAGDELSGGLSSMPDPVAHQSLSPSNLMATPAMAAVPNEIPVTSMLQNPTFDHGPLTSPAGFAIPSATGLNADTPDLGINTNEARLPDEIPINSDMTPFQLPREIALAPEPRDIHAAFGAPNPPEGIEHDQDATKPYWLAGRTTGIEAEKQFQPLTIIPIHVDLNQTQIVENLPAPPKRPPEKPPGKEWIVGKVVAMSGQEFTTGEPDEKTAPAASADSGGYYWAPSNSGAKHGAKPSSSAQREKGFFDVDVVRKDFPILQQKVNGKPLVWLDNAATTQKPQAMIDRITKFYQEENSNVHRAAHELAARSTDAYEAAREKVRRFMGAGSTEEIVFTRGTTESINLVAQTYGKQHLGEGDEIIVTEMEHHSNIVPWQHITKETGAKIVVAPFLDSGEMDLVAYERLFNKRTKMVAITHVSNALGTVNPVQQMVATAHRNGVVALVDGAQSMPHFPINVQDINADFYVMSGHKLFGPTGVGVMYGKKHLLEEMPPWQGGGNMIESVSFEETRYNPSPYKFEAGTGILAGAVGLGAAIDYLERIGFMNASRYEDALLEYGQEKLRAINGVTMIGEAKHKAGVMSFVTKTVTPGEMGEALNQEGIAVRTGHHCAQPALAHYGLTATIRPSLAFYNTKDEIDLLVRTVIKTIKAKG